MGTAEDSALCGEVSARTLQLRAALERVGTGDERAFEELYEVMAPRVLGLVRCILVGHSQSEQITREVFLEIWQTAAHYDADQDAPAAWIMAIAHRRAIERVRAARADPSRDHKVALRDLKIEHDCVTEAANAGPERQLLTSALLEITPLQREAVTLAYFGGFTTSDVAHRVGAPRSIVTSRMRDGLLRLRTVLAEHISA